MVRNILALLTGTIVAFLAIMLVETLGHVVYPPPANLDMHDPAVMKAFIASLPMGAFLFVLAAWCAGAFAGGWLAARIAGGRAWPWSSVVAGMVLLGSIAMMAMIPHPLWFRIAAVASIPATGLLAAQVAERTRRASPTPEGAGTAT